MSTDISIIIPHRGNSLGLWATLHSCYEDLKHSDITYNFVIVTNGEKLTAETKKGLAFIEEAGKLKQHLHCDEPLTPPVARQRGAQIADGRLLCFFDNHCLVARDYFKRVVYDFERRYMDVLHSVTNYTMGWPVDYHYRLKLDYNFWAESARVPNNNSLPYKISAAG